jgi:predicted TIM-barrel fold metal-dependent hydrolase
MQGDAARDAALRLATHQAYNDWIADLDASAPDRIVGLGAIPTWDVQESCAEARRIAARGLRGVIIPSWSPTDAQYNDPVWGPVWSSFEELDLPVSMHLGTRLHWLNINRVTVGYFSVSKVAMAQPLAIFKFGGPLVKHPGMKIVLAEAGIGWLAYHKEFMETMFRRHRFWTKLEMPEPPRHYFDRRVFATFIVVMEHTTLRNEPKLVERCTLALTCRGVVRSVVTDLAWVDVTPEGFLLRELAPGWTFDEVQALSAARLRPAPDPREMAL